MASLFNQNSFFDRKEEVYPPYKLPPVVAKARVALAQSTFADWLHRIEAASREAGDAELLALESDLLDLRDEIVHALHTKICYHLSNG